MNILLYDFMHSYIQHDLVYYLEKMGHKCNNIACQRKIDKYEDEEFMAQMESETSAGNYDLVLTTNFWPVVAKVCKNRDLPYVAWLFDSPPNLRSTECMDYPGNRIFFFARSDFERHRNYGLENVYHLPLAVNTERLQKIAPENDKYGSDISFVGSLYNSMFGALAANMDEYQKGYINAVINIQMEIFGEYIVDNVITEEFTDSVRKRYRDLSDKAFQVERDELAWAVISQATRIERLTLLALLSKRYKTKLYTYEAADNFSQMVPNVECHGPVDYLTEMPKVFKASKVNLCPVLKANRSGIPLRALDIMGCKGFLLSSYQSELFESFVDGQECVMYTSLQDALEKADYYIRNDELREQIALAGFEKVKRDFRYEDRIECLLKDL